MTLPSGTLLAQSALSGLFVGALTFQAHLVEGSDVIEYHYCSMNVTTGTRHSGGSATIGVENGTGSEGVSISFNTAGAVSTGSGFRLTPP